MEATIQHSTDVSIVDALWAILNQQTEGVKRALSVRLVNSLSANPKVSHSKTVALTDDELAEKLAAYPDFADCNHHEMTEEQFHQVARSLSGKLPQSVSKWL